ncbi:MAG TPA: adenylate/guanylate cyclase domain-containing protein [Burkholderiales bacterium]
MTSPLQRDALRRILEIVRESRGSSLDREAVRRIEAALAAMAPSAPPPPAGYSEHDATVVFADLRGFSAIAAAYPVEVVLGALNRCFARLADIVLSHYGSIDKFMGDAIMAVFHGDPASPRDHARRAMLGAVEMQLAMEELRRLHDAEHLPELYLGIGVNSGKVMAGLIGSPAYRAYTVIGDEVNIAARVEALSLRGQVLMSEATYQRVKDFVHAGEAMEVHVKGRSQLMRVREALGIPALGRSVPRQDLRKSPRAAVRGDVDYWPLEGKRVRPEAGRAVMHDLSYHGMLAELDEPLPLYSEVKLAFDLPPLGFRASDVYARVVSLREGQGRLLAGIEFTSLGDETSANLRLFVQMLLQGEFHAIG